MSEYEIPDPEFDDQPAATPAGRAEGLADQTSAPVSSPASAPDSGDEITVRTPITREQAEAIEADPERFKQIFAEQFAANIEQFAENIEAFAARAMEPLRMLGVTLERRCRHCGSTEGVRDPLTPRVFCARCGRNQ